MAISWGQQAKHYVSRAARRLQIKELAPNAAIQTFATKSQPSAMGSTQPVTICIGGGQGIAAIFERVS